MTKFEVTVVAVVVGIMGIIVGGALSKGTAPTSTKTVHAEALQQPAKPQDASTPEMQAVANALIKDVGYMQDPRTEFCFVFIMGGGQRTTLVRVPCDSVPASLLIVATP